jgi:hypothetical protein
MPRTRTPYLDEYLVDRPVIRGSSTNGDGTGTASPKVETGRIADLEKLVGEMRHILDVQFRRMADMQAEIDILRAKQHATEKTPI